MKIKAVQLDLARQKETPAFIKEFAAFAKKCGYNALFLYLEGMIRTPSFPCKTAEESYTVAEMKDIVKHCGKLGLEVIPCVSTLGHTELFLQHEELHHLGELDGGVEGRWFKKGYYNHTCPSREATYEFFEKYLGEMAEIFPSKYFHAGLDECWEIGLCPECRDKHDDRDGYAGLYSYHINRVHKILKKLGRRMMMWDDLFALYPQSLKQIPRDIVMCMWCYDFNAPTAVDHISRNRLRHDPYEEYDRLGFDYLTCPAAIYPQNILCQTRLAEKHRPLGGIVTQWEKSKRFYQASYAMIALAGLRWNSGKKAGDAGLVDGALKKVGIADAATRAALASAMTLKQRYTAGRDAACFLGDVAHVEEERLAALELILSQAGKYVSDEKNPVLQDMALTAWEGQIQRRIRKYYFEAAQARFMPADAAPSVCRKTLLADLARFRDLRLRQWKRFRPGIPCADFEKHFAAMIADVKNLEGELKRRTHLLKLNLFLPEMYCTPFLTLKVDGKTLKENVQLKPIGEETAYYTYFLPFSGAKSPRKIEIEYKGCGGIGVAYASVLAGRGEFAPEAVGECVGTVQNPQALLTENQQWCYLGEHEARRIFFWNDSRKIKSSVALLLRKK